MKARIGFISNSSTTSFIIFYKKGKQCPACGREDLDICELFKRGFQHGDWTEFVSDNPEITIETFEKDEWIPNDTKKYLVNFIKKNMKNKRTWKFVYGDVEYEDILLRREIRSLFMQRKLIAVIDNFSEYKGE